MNGYKNLDVWKKSLQLTVLVYKITRLFPKEELYSLTSQMRRAAVSLPSNIAEGSKRGTKKDFCQFLRIAQGSGAELETQLLLAERLEYISADDFKDASLLLDDVMKMLTAFIKKLLTSDE